MSKIFVVMGKSATGKDTIYKRLLEMKELSLRPLVSYTTRPIRKGEVSGKEYFFVTEDKLHGFMEKKKVIEHRSYNTIHGVWNYFTVDDQQMDQDQGNYIIINTLEAYEKIRNFYGKDRVIPVYIEVEDGLRLCRALNRERKQKEPRYAELCRRFLADTEDFAEENLQRIQISKRYNNKNLDSCLQSIKKDIKRILSA